MAQMDILTGFSGGGMLAAVRRRLRLVLLVALVGSFLAAAMPLPASGHSHPSIPRCKALGIWKGQKSFSGYIYPPPSAVLQYWVRVSSVFPYGWSGTVKFGNWSAHPPVWIPVGTKHWFPSPADIPWSPYTPRRYNFTVIPNYGVFSSYAVDLMSSYRCT
jgi:hypothetical protein